MRTLPLLIFAMTLKPVLGFKLRSMLKPVTRTFVSLHTSATRLLELAEAEIVGVDRAASARAAPHAIPNAIATAAAAFIRILCACMTNLPRIDLVTFGGRDSGCDAVESGHVEA